MARASSFLGRVESIEGVCAEFIPRVEGVPVSVDKWETLVELEPAHREIVNKLGFSWEQLWRAEQVHGDGVAAVPMEGDEQVLPDVDGLLTSGEEGCLLGIYVADCAAVYLCDRRTGALGLVHSGKKGTEMEIAVRAAKELGAPAIIGSMAFDRMFESDDVRTMMGTSPEDAAERMAELGVDIVALNCGTDVGMDRAAAIVRRYREQYE